WAANGAPAPTVGTRPRCVARARHATHATHGRPIGPAAATSGAPLRPPPGRGFPRPQGLTDDRAKDKRRVANPPGGAIGGVWAGRRGGTPSNPCHILLLRPRGQVPPRSGRIRRSGIPARRSGPVGPASWPIVRIS